MKKKEKQPKKQEPGKPDLPKPGYFKNLKITGRLNQLIVTIGTIVTVVVLILIGFLTYLGIFPEFFFSWMDYILFALLAGTGIYGIYMAVRLRRIHKIDSIFPDFVRDLAESRRAGMTFTKAILFASKGNYGILSTEIQKIAQQVSWGSSVDDALLAFS